MLPPGNLLVVVAPSGTGKTTLVQALIDTTPGIMVSVSHTTRKPRSLETPGIHYHFVDESEFKLMIERNDFLEYALVFNHWYGTSKTWVKKTLSHGIDVVLEIDWQGAQQIQQLFPECISIFILPPSPKDLSLRLNSRNQDIPDIIKTRLKDARETVSHINQYDYVVVNADVEQAVNDLKIIVLASRLLQKKQTIKYAGLLTEFTKT